MADEGHRSASDEPPGPDDDRRDQSGIDEAPTETVGSDRASGTHADAPEADEGLDWIDRDTILDIVVNAIPMAILLFFIVLYTIVQPWGSDSLLYWIMHFLTVLPFVLLGILTYYAARAISRDEALLEHEERRITTVGTNHHTGHSEGGRRPLTADEDGQDPPSASGDGQDSPSVSGDGQE
jgi:hypothetical protein